VRLERLTRGHVVAAVAALALLLVMAMDWYGSVQADEARRIGSVLSTRGAESGEEGRAAKQDVDRIIARDEKNAWQTQAFVDRLLLVLLLLTVFLPLLAAALRAEGRRPEPPWTPSAFAALCASAAALLVAYRILQQPGPNATTTIKIGPVLALGMLAAVALGSVSAFQKEADYAAMRRAATTPPPETEGPMPDDPPGRARPAAPQQGS
jgi:hypothetical protein